MAHDHDHSHDEHYFLDQIATVAVCGLLAGIGFLAWRVNLLMEYNILAPQFNLPVLLGSIALAVMVAVRAVTLWSEVGKRKPAHAHVHGHSHHHDHDHVHGSACDHEHHHDHDHDHHHHQHAPGEKCDHEHHHHEHEHGHSHSHDHSHDGHDHGFAPWRYAVMLLPLILSGLLLYYKFNGLQLTYSAERVEKLLKHQTLEGGDVVEKEGKGGAVESITQFRTFTDSGANPRDVGWYDGRDVRVRGLYSQINDKEFSVFRLDMKCCAGDAVAISIRGFAKDSLSRYGLKGGKGVEIVGQVQYRKVQGSDKMVPIIVAKELTPVELGNDIFDKS